MPSERRPSDGFPSSSFFRLLLPCTCLQAQSGSGKTACFVVGALQRLDVSNRATQILILAPSSELAQQIGGVCKYIEEYMGISSETFVGGQSVRQDLRAAKQVQVRFLRRAAAAAAAAAVAVAAVAL